jgi:hypothetical protein
MLYNYQRRYELSVISLFLADRTVIVHMVCLGLSSLSLATRLAANATRMFISYTIFFLSQSSLSCRDCLDHRGCNNNRGLEFKYAIQSWTATAHEGDTWWDTVLKAKGLLSHQSSDRARSDEHHDCKHKRAEPVTYSRDKIYANENKWFRFLSRTNCVEWSTGVGAPRGRRQNGAGNKRDARAGNRGRFGFLR